VRLSTSLTVPQDQQQQQQAMQLQRINGQFIQEYAMQRHADTLQLQNTDLVAGVYEGGFKLWECAIDLVNYLIEGKVIETLTQLKQQQSQSQQQSQQKQQPLLRVLEVGCGHGIPAIYCLKRGAHVQFQDYVRC